MPTPEYNKNMQRYAFEADYNLSISNCFLVFRNLIFFVGSMGKNGTEFAALSPRNVIFGLLLK
jgi:hypothetical protein